MVELQNIIESMGEIVPAEETLEKLISWARNHPDSPLDEPWSLGCLAEVEIPPEALLAIMQIMRKRLPHAELDLTIREAMWIARLHKLFDDLELLDKWASAYAARERVCWILEWPHETSSLDLQLMSSDRTRFPWAFGWWGEDEKSLSEKLKKKGYDAKITSYRELRRKEFLEKNPEFKREGE